MFYSDHKNVSENLLFAEQQVIPNSACIGFYGNDKELITPNVLCSISIDGRQAASIGDGGAALVINEFGKHTAIGLLSVIHEDLTTNRVTIPVVFTRITSYYDWIVQVTGCKF